MSVCIFFHLNSEITLLKWPSYWINVLIPGWSSKPWRCWTSLVTWPPLAAAVVLPTQGYIRGCGAPPARGWCVQLSHSRGLCERGSVWRIHVAGDRDIGQLYVFSVYFLSSQENGKGWDSLEQLLGHQGPSNPPCPVQLSVWSSACDLPRHISQPIISQGSLSLVMMWQWS